MGLVYWKGYGFLISRVGVGVIRRLCLFGWEGLVVWSREAVVLRREIGRFEGYFGVSRCLYLDVDWVWGCVGGCVYFMIGIGFRWRKRLGLFLLFRSLRMVESG